MDAQRALVDRALPAQRALSESAETAAPVSNFTHQGYLDAVETAKDYISET